MTSSQKKDYFDKPDNYFDNTQIEDHFRCPAFYMWRWVMKIETTLPNINLLFGNSEHDPLALYNEFIMNAVNLTPEGKEQAKKDALKLMAEIMLNAPLHDKKHLNNGVKLFHETIKQHEINPLIQGKIIGVEQEIEKEIYPGIFYFGKIDVKIEQDKKIMIMDYKTKSQIKNSFISSILLSRQIRGYLWLSDSNIMGLIILHCLKNPKVEIPSPNFISNEELERWKLETTSLVKSIYKNTQRARYVEDSSDTLYELFPRSGLKCADWGCCYQRLCEQNCGAEDVFVDSQYYKSPDIEEMADMYDGGDPYEDDFGCDINDF